MSDLSPDKPVTGSGAAADFFDRMDDRYTCEIEKCVPRYREMLATLIEYLPGDRRYGRVLELGSGSGNLSELILRTIKPPALTLVDLSANLMKECRRRLASYHGVSFQLDDFATIDYPDQSFDLVISSIALHHLPDSDKAELFRRVFRWLGSGGLFVFADQFAGATTDINDQHLAAWQRFAREQGVSSAQWDDWMQHQSQHDHHSSLPDQVGMLRQAGFRTVDCPWRFLLWTILQARR